MASSLAEFAYGISFAAIEQQERRLGELRSRTGTLLAAATVAASFLGAEAARSGKVGVRGNPAKGAWHHDVGLRGQAAVKYAAEHGAYTLFGVTPFMVGQSQRHLRIVPLVLGDPLLQRVMATIVVSPAKLAGLNHAGALALQRHLLQPQAQAEIRDFRVPGVKHGLWWPAGRNNEASLLPLSRPAAVQPGSGAGSGTGGGNGKGLRHS